MSQKNKRWRKKKDEDEIARRIWRNDEHRKEKSRKKIYIYIKAESVSFLNKTERKIDETSWVLF